jgi:hypothetical protein
MAATRQLAFQVTSLAEVAKPDQQMYTSDASSGGYKLTYVGEALARYRRHAAENRDREVPPPTKIVRFDRQDWAKLIAVAEPEARSYFLKMAGSGVIKVVG